MLVSPKLPGMISLATSQKETTTVVAVMVMAIMIMVMVMTRRNRERKSEARGRGGGEERRSEAWWRGSVGRVIVQGIGGTVMGRTNVGLFRK